MLRRIIVATVGILAIGGAFVGGLAVGVATPREPTVVEIDRIVTVPVDRVVTVFVTPETTVPGAIPTPGTAAVQQEAASVCRTIPIPARDGIAEARVLAAQWVEQRYGDRPDKADLIEPCARGIINGRVSGQSRSPVRNTSPDVSQIAACRQAQINHLAARRALDPTGRDRASVQRLANANARVLELCY